MIIIIMSLSKYRVDVNEWKEFRLKIGILWPWILQFHKKIHGNKAKIEWEMVHIRSFIHSFVHSF